MANGITQGNQGTFVAQLEANGSNIVLPAGSSWAWSASDTTAVITPVTSDPTGGTVTVAVPAGDPSTTVTVTASTVDPAGGTVSGSVTVPVLAQAVVYTVTVGQVS